MAKLLRLALQVVLFFILLSVVVSIARPETGPLEKGALVLAAAALVWRRPEFVMFPGNRPRRAIV